MQHSAPTRTVLIADDESLIRFSLASLFQGAGTEVLSVETGIAALAAVRSCRLDLCFLDIHLPDLNGLDIMKALRAISPWTRIIIVTGNLMTDAMMRTIRENAHALITKPFDLEEVEAVAVRLLAPGRMPSGDALPAGKKDSCVLWVAETVRKHPRRPDGRDIVCYAVAPPGGQEPVRVPARVVDTSDSGMCILTQVELRPGHIVRSGDGSLPGSGVVRWCDRSAPGQACRIGIQFIAQQHIDYLMGASGPCPSGGGRHGTRS